MRKIPPVEIEFRIVLARAAPAARGEAPCPASAADRPLPRLTAWLARISDRFAVARPSHQAGGDLLGAGGDLDGLISHHQDPAGQDQQHVGGVGDGQRGLPTSR